MKDEIQKSYGAFSFWQSSERKQEGDRTQHGEHDRNKQWFASRKANREEKGESAWQTQDGVAEILAAGRSLLLLLDREPIQLIGGQLPSE